MMWFEVLLVLGNEYLRFAYPLTLSTFVAITSPLWALLCFSLAFRAQLRHKGIPIVLSCFAQPLAIAVFAWPAARAGIGHSAEELASTVDAIARFIRDHQGHPPEELSVLVPRYISAVPTGLTACRRPRYQVLAPHTGTYLYRLGTGELGFNAVRRAAYLEVQIAEEVLVRDSGLTDDDLKSALQFNQERWSAEVPLRSRMARDFTLRFHAELARGQSRDALAQKTLDILGAPDSAYAPASLWQFELTSCDYLWGKVIYWDGGNYAEYNDGMRLHSVIAGWAYYHDTKLL